MKIKERETERWKRIWGGERIDKLNKYNNEEDRSDEFKYKRYKFLDIMEFEGTHGEIYKEGEGVIVMIDRGSIIIIKKR